MQWFLNYVPAENISLFDRGFAYGDGLFETIATYNGTVRSLDLHRSRLARGLKRLAFDLDAASQDQLWDFVQQQADSQPNCGIKVIVTRGCGGRGYMPPEISKCEIVIGIFDSPDYSALKQQGVGLHSSAVECSINRSLSGLKHLNRLENVLAKQALEGSAYEAVMKNAKGQIVECIQSNIFWVKQGVLFTPALTESGVQGSMRGEILRSFHGTINITVNDQSALEAADEIFVTNALSGIVPVVQFGSKVLPIGSVTQTLMEQLNET